MGADVLAKGIKSSRDYINKQKENQWLSAEKLLSFSEFPKNPDGSNDWNTFLEKEKFDFKKFREEVLKKNIKSISDYRRQKENHRDYEKIRARRTWSGIHDHRDP